MVVLKRIFFGLLIVVVLIAGFIFIWFGSALSQEGNPTPILAAIFTLESSNNEYVQFAETDRGKRYVSKNTGVSRYEVVKEFMKTYAWTFREQMGSGLVFGREDQDIVVETRQFSRHYTLWNIPNEVRDSQ